MNKFLSLLSLWSLSLFSIQAWALNAEPLEPHYIVDVGGISTVYYADSSQGAIVVDPEFKTYDLTDASSYNNIYFTMRSMDANKRYLYIFAEGTDTDTHFPIPIAYSSYGSVYSQGGLGNQYSYVYFPEGSNDVQIGINLQSLCSSGSAAQLAKGCTGGTVDTTTSTTGITLKFLQSDTATTPSDASTIDSGFKLKVIPENQPPVIGSAGTCPGLSTWFFPGDQEFSVDTSSFQATKNSLGAGSSSFNTLIVAIGDTTLPPSPYFGGASIHRLPYGSGPQTITGDFTNSTQAAQVFYEANVGVRSTGGLVSYCSGTYQIFTTDIKSFLRESNCFIASAAYQSQHAKPVLLLRQFRDQILFKFTWGRRFIHYYYTYGPRAADWLIDHPAWRWPVLVALTPALGIAWLSLHPQFLWFPIFGGMGLLLYFFRKKLLKEKKQIQKNSDLTLFLLFAFFCSSLGFSKGAHAAQPSIDSLLSEIPTTNEPQRTIQNPDPYIQSQKEKLGHSDSDSFIQSVQSEITLDSQSPHPSQGYTQRIKESLDPSKREESAIQNFKEGKKLRANKGSIHTKSAIAIKISTAMNRSYQASQSDSTRSLPYETMYGQGYVPEITISYDYHPFSSSWLRGLGMYSSLGASFTQAKGKLDYSGPSGEFGSDSRTRFLFTALPFQLGPILRLRLASWLVPYAAGGGSVIGFVENRNDKKKSARGYSWGYWGIAGVSVGLDPLSRKFSWDQYESQSIKRTYLSVEYSYWSTLPGGIVTATISGIQAGLTFEY